MKLLGAPGPTAKGKCLLETNGVGALPKVLKAHMGEVVLSTDPTRGKTAWPPRALAQRGGIVARYALGYYSVAPTTH